MAADTAPDAADPSGSAVCVLNYDHDPRTQALLALKSFWDGSQHDHAPASWDGVPRQDQCDYLSDRFRMAGYESTNLNADAWGYGSRRPNSAAPMPRSIVSAFTAALLGRQPQLSTPSDPKTARYLTACWDDSDGWAVLTEARSYAGAQGAAAIVVSIVEGQLALDAYWAHEMHVLEWENCVGWRPKRAVWQTKISVEQDPDDTGSVESRLMVRTKEWTDTEVILYEDVEQGHEGPIPERERVPHEMGRCPVVWLQNTRNSREPEGVYDLQTPQVLELCDQLDRVQSFAVRATKANASPTLYRKDHMHWLMRGTPIRKGHGAEITGTPDGDVKFLESDGAGVTNSWSTSKQLKLQIMQACNVILPDMDWAISNIAVETFLMLFQAMDAQCDLLQTPLRRCIREICGIFIALGIARGIVDREADQKNMDAVRLPPAVTVIEPEDDDDPTAEPKTTTEAHEVGKAREVTVIWPPRRLLSPMQFKDFVAGITLAVGGKLMSEESAIEALATARGQTDPAAERRRIRAEKAKAKADLLRDGLVPGGGLVGDQAAADAAMDEEDAGGDGDGDGIMNESGPPMAKVKPPTDA